MRSAVQPMFGTFWFTGFSKTEKCLTVGCWFFFLGVGGGGGIIN